MQKCNCKKLSNSLSFQIALHNCSLLRYKDQRFFLWTILVKRIFCARWYEHSSTLPILKIESYTKHSKACHVAEKKIFVSHLLGFCQWHRTNKTPKMDQNFAAKMSFVLFLFSGKGLDGHILSWLHVSFEVTLSRSWSSKILFSTIKIINSAFKLKMFLSRVYNKCWLIKISVHYN